ncbi:MAG: hypothetical protein WD512_03770 [Candidatus Paceibacterota bacterium]
MIVLKNKTIKGYSYGNEAKVARIRLTPEEISEYKLNRYDRIDKVELVSKERDNTIVLYRKEVVQYGDGLCINIKAKEMRLFKLQIGDRFDSVRLFGVGE